MARCRRRLAPNPASRSELERIGCRARNSYPFSIGGRYPEPGSRTPVTGFPVLRSYRFFETTASDWVHATASLPRRFPPDAPESALARWNGVSCLLLTGSGGYICAVEESERRGMLLPLRGVAPAGRMRENVRFEKDCATLVGDDLCETPHAVACGRFECRAAIPSSRTGGARPTRRKVASL